MIGSLPRLSLYLSSKFLLWRLEPPWISAPIVGYITSDFLRFPNHDSNTFGTLQFWLMLHYVRSESEEEGGDSAGEFLMLFPLVILSHFPLVELFSWAWREISFVVWTKLINWDHQFWQHVCNNRILLKGSNQVDLWKRNLLVFSSLAVTAEDVHELWNKNELISILFYFRLLFPLIFYTFMCLLSLFRL